MPRSRALFVDIYRLAGSSMFGNPHRFSLTFLSASDEGCFDEAVYAARLTKEAASLAHWQGVAAGLRSLPELQAWLHSDHLCYAVQRQHEFGKRTIKVWSVGCGDAGLCEVHFAVAKEGWPAPSKREPELGWRQRLLAHGWGQWIAGSTGAQNSSVTMARARINRASPCCSALGSWRARRIL
eukprot:GHRQ01037852.1.p2 GENE.GHRQ01037852.1~~GHRQ01037852.1.p2  ORF type:complete len:182 (+),score=46.13 GHRQ01037852.1:473-1018(+)